MLDLSQRGALLWRIAHENYPIFCEWPPTCQCAYISVHISHSGKASLYVFSCWMSKVWLWFLTLHQRGDKEKRQAAVLWSYFAIPHEHTEVKSYQHFTLWEIAAQNARFWRAILSKDYREFQSQPRIAQPARDTGFLLLHIPDWGLPFVGATGGRPRFQSRPPAQRGRARM